jgi:protein involved in sex pheromone biosynthesis
MKKAILIIVAAASLLLAACSKVTQNNYDKVESGLSRAEVEAIIGKATTCKEALGVAS